MSGIKTGPKGRTLGVKVYPMRDFRVDHMGCALAEVGLEAYVICTEGVGWKVEAAGFKTNDFDPEAHVYTLEELRSLTDEPVDLAEWVRTFGDRLEVNFGIWFKTLGGQGREHG